MLCHSLLRVIPTILHISTMAIGELIETTVFVELCSTISEYRTVFSWSNVLLKSLHSHFTVIHLIKATIYKSYFCLYFVNVTRTLDDLSTLVLFID